MSHVIQIFDLDIYSIRMHNSHSWTMNQMLYIHRSSLSFFIRHFIQFAIYFIHCIN